MPLRAHLQALTAVDAREEEAIARTLTALDEFARPFDKEAQAVHITASAIVRGPRGVLLHRHKRLGRWLQPGGHIDEGEQPPEAAVRETAEETGVHAVHPATGPFLIHVDVHEVAYGHVHLDLRYLLSADDVEPCPQPGESPDAEWFSLERAEDIADPGLAGALAALRARVSDS